MIRNIEVIDAPRLLYFKHQSSLNMLYDFEGSLTNTNRSFSALKYIFKSLSPYSHNDHYLWSNKTKIDAVIRSVKIHNGFIWHIAELYSRNSSLSVAEKTIHKICDLAASNGAYQVKIRLPAESPLYNSLINLGFVMVQKEISLQLSSSFKTVVDIPKVHTLGELRPETSADLFSIYQMHLKTSPKKLNSIRILNFNDWLNNSKNINNSSQKFVYEEKGSITASIEIAIVEKTRLVKFDCSLIDKPKIKELIATILTSGYGSCVRTLIPEHNQVIFEAFRESGFVVNQKYQVFYKKIKMPVTFKPKVIVSA
jgi:hypothetical protein|tara:strand:+ start:353 stop:1285 length:933 start_codon:yes stop_codon:yes gene_type:complete